MNIRRPNICWPVDCPSMEWRMTSALVTWIIVSTSVSSESGMSLENTSAFSLSRRMSAETRLRVRVASADVALTLLFTLNMSVDVPKMRLNMSRRTVTEASLEYWMCLSDFDSSISRVTLISVSVNT